MYSTCLFCNGPLGQNEVLEDFPVGRRLAYDPAKGRLWVVCSACERWNLTPLDTRWEAIEEAERLYRGAVLKVATDNVGLAQLSEGIELVRLGSAPRLEFAAWRYGDQFGRRRRRFLALGATAALAVSAPYLQFLGVAAAVGLAGAGVGLGFQGIVLLKRWFDTHRDRLFVRAEDGAVFPLTLVNARCAALVPTGDYGNWTLQVPHHAAGAAATMPFVLRTLGHVPRDQWIVLHGDAAHRALATILPHLNRGGGSARRVREATEVVASSKSVRELLRLASVNTEAKRTHVKLIDGESNISVLPARIRLALEMALHEDDERRAMDGELDGLEQRWREAEEIAAIADGLTLPPGMDDALDDLRRRDGANAPGSRSIGN